MKTFDVARIFYFDLDFMWCEVPTDEEYRQAIKKYCECVGSFVMAYDPTSIKSIIGKIPYTAHWHDNYIVIGNVKDGYVIDKDEMECLYNNVQSYIAELLYNATYFSFDEDEFKNKVIDYIKEQHA